MPLRAQSPTLQSLIENIHSAVCILDHKYRYAGFNKAHADAMKARHGTRVKIGRSVLDYIGEEKERRNLQKDLDRAFHGKTFVKRSGHFQVTYSPLRSRNGGIAGVALSATRVQNSGPGAETSRQGARAGSHDVAPSGAKGLFQNTNDVLRAIIDAAPTAIIGLDLAGRVTTMWNRGAEKMLGWSAPEVMGQVLPTVPREHEGEFKQLLHQVLSGKCLEGVEVHRQRRDGSPIDYSVYASPVHNSHGDVSGNIAVLVDVTENKRANIALHESEEKFRSIVETALAGIFAVDDEYRLVYVNDELCRLLGYTREELIGKDVRKYLPDAVSEALAGDDRPRQGEKFPTRRELSLQRRDGELRHVEMTVAVVRDSAGRVRCMGQLYDITERMRVTKALHMFQYTIDQDFDAVFWITRDAHFSYVNDQACRSLGYSREELTRLSLWDIDPIYPKDRWESNWESYQKDRQGGAEQIETLHRRKDGTTFPVEVSSQHLWFDDQELHVAVVRDISERKRVEKALKEKTDELDRYFTSSLDLLCIADSDGYFRRLNPAWEKTLGYSIRELEGKSFLDLIHPDDFQSTKDVVSRLKRQEEVLNFENRYRCKDGTYRWIEWRSYPTGDSIYAIARDVTSRKRAEDALRSSLREKEVLLKEIHHRVKNNLQIIASMLHLQAEHAADERILTQFREAQNRVLSIAMVHQKLYGSTDLAEVDFSEYLHDFIRGLFRAYGDTQANLHLDVGDIHLPIDAAIPCGLIINELVSNSLKYAFPKGRGGTISLTMHAEGSEGLVLAVHDDGVGIPERTDPFHGETLGLTLVSILVQQLGGTIDLDKTDGTLFTIRFRRSAA